MVDGSIPAHQMANSRAFGGRTAHEDGRRWKAPSMSLALLTAAARSDVAVVVAKVAASSDAFCWSLPPSFAVVVVASSVRESGDGNLHERRAGYAPLLLLRHDQHDGVHSPVRY